MNDIIGKIILYFSINSRSDVIDDISSFIENDSDMESRNSITFEKIEKFVEKYCDKTKDGTKCE